MSEQFDKKFWDEQWDGHGDRPSMADNPPNPHLISEVSKLGREPGTALEAGCGAGAEAIWLAEQGWQVTAVDVSSEALTTAAQRAEAAGVGDQLRWVEADLDSWAPEQNYDLVTSHYAHSTMPQLEFHRRLGEWVSPGGTLFLVGHAGGHAHQHHPHETEPHHSEGHDHTPEAASVSAEAVAASFDAEHWQLETALEAERTLPGHQRRLHDVVVRLRRLP